MNSLHTIEKLKSEILQSFDKAAVKYKTQEGGGYTITLGVNPRDLNRLCVPTAPLQYLACQVSHLFKLLLPHHKFSSVCTRDSAGKGLHRDLRNSHYPQAIVSLSNFEGGELWVESPTGTIEKQYMGGVVLETHCDVASGAPFIFSCKRLLHCTEEWTGRRVVVIAFTVMGSISIARNLDNLLGALGFTTPDSLEVDYYSRQLVGPGQLKQSTLRTKQHPHVWKAGKFKHGDPTTLVLSDSEDDTIEAVIAVDTNPYPDTPQQCPRRTYIDSCSLEKDSQKSLATMPWPREEVSVEPDALLFHSGDDELYVPMTYGEGLATLRHLLAQWGLLSPEQVQNQNFTLHSCKTTLLSWANQLSLSEDLRAVQGHHRNSSARLCSRDDVFGAPALQSAVLKALQGGWRPLCPQHRGGQVPLQGQLSRLVWSSLSLLKLHTLP